MRGMQRFNVVAPPWAELATLLFRSYCSLPAGVPGGFPQNLSRPSTWTYCGPPTLEAETQRSYWPLTGLARRRTTFRLSLQRSDIA